MDGKLKRAIFVAALENSRKRAKASPWRWKRPKGKRVPIGRPVRSRSEW